MENSRTKPEASSSDVEPDKQSPKHAEHLGALIVEQEPQHTSEHLGHLIVEGEREREETAKSKRPKGSEARPKLPAAKNVETMKRSDLLELSRGIVIDGSSLHQIYETRLIGERGLRRLIVEYLRGGDIKRLLRLEIIEREIDFERDPALRDRRHQLIKTGLGLKQLLEQAASSSADNKEKEEAAFYRARAAYDSWEQVNQQKQRRTVDVAMVGTIFVLIILLLILLLTRH